MPVLRIQTKQIIIMGHEILLKTLYIMSVTLASGLKPGSVSLFTIKMYRKCYQSQVLASKVKSFVMDLHTFIVVCMEFD